MKKNALIVLVAAVLLLGGAIGAVAQVRLDADINEPMYIGLTLNGVRQGVWNSYFIPLPDLQAFIVSGKGPIVLGAGVRVYTVIIENILYPEVMAELHLDQAMIYANVGGFALLEFGLLTSLLQGVGVNTLTGWHNVLMSDVGVGLRLNDWFALCAGVYIISPFDNSLGGVLSTNVFAAYVTAKFTTYFFFE